MHPLSSPALNARWDRYGGVITRPRWARVDDQLRFQFAKIAWAGHVVLG